jgi:putative permease
VTKKIIEFGLAVMVTLLALFLMWQFRVALIYVLVSLLFAAALRPLISRLAGKKFIVRLSWILLYISIIAVIGFILFLTGKAAVVETQQLTLTLSSQNTWQLPTWLAGNSFLQGQISALPSPSKVFEAFVGVNGQLVLPALLGFTQGITTFITGTIIILLLTIYWIINQIHFERLWLSLLESGNRKLARGIWRTIEPEIGGYLRGQVVYSLLAGVVLGLGYWAMGSQYPALLALGGAFACFVPVVGAALAVVLPLLVGLMTGVQFSLFTVLYTIIVIVALIVWVKPKLYNRKWDNPILTLVIMVVMARAFGILGIIVAPPISAMCQIIWSRLVRNRRPLGASALVSDLKERQVRILETISVMDEPPPPLVISSLEQLNLLIEKAEPVIRAGLQDNTNVSDPSGSVSVDNILPRQS